MGEGPFPTGRMEHPRDGRGEGHLNFGPDRILFIGRGRGGYLPSQHLGLIQFPLLWGAGSPDEL